MKILIISPTSSGIGGIAQHVCGLVEFLRKNGHKVKVMSSENTFTIPIKGLKNPSFMISSFLKSGFQKGFDIVHAHNVPSALAMKNIKAKKVLSLQGMFGQQVELLHGNTLGKASANFETKALDWADAITVPSQEMYDYYSNKGYKVYHVPNAIDVSSFTQEEDRRYDKQIIYAGRLSQEKGILDVLDISDKLTKDIHLIIAGSGPEEHKVRHISKKYPNVHYLGYQSKKNTIKLIRGSDILVQPSIMEGGTSSTLLEAMACKTPIIATSVGGNKETIIHMKTAYVVKPNTPAQILEAINSLLSDPIKAQSLSKEAFDVIKNYTWETVGQKYIAIYEAILP